MLGKNKFEIKFVFIAITLLFFMYGCGKNIVSNGDEMLYDKIKRETNNSKEYEQYVISYTEQNKKIIGQDNIIVFTGSSTIAGWNSLMTDFNEYNVVNRHFSGCYIEHIIKNLDVIALDLKPAVVVIYVGDNDVFIKNIETYNKQLDCLLYKLKQMNSSVRIVLLSMKPSPARKEYFDIYIKMNEIMERKAKYNKRIDFINIWDAMFIGKIPDESLFKEDKTHLNAQGYAIITPFVKALFEEKHIPKK